MWKFVALMLHEQRFLHLILIWELTNAPQVGMLPHSDFTAYGWLLFQHMNLPQGPAGVF